ncbi:MAG TPA: hypothetical protein VFC71_04295 [Candidatus Polarisedimenticolia bacterium]|nr:hypothetical protein [Candidatus Polarisedimenticolia bacterium]
MDDPRWEPGMPILDRQGIGVPQRTVPELAPTPLQRHYINLSAVGLVCGFIAITALEFGASLSDLIVKLPVLVGAPLILLTTADAMLRIWRSARAWLPINRGRGLFRVAWVAAAGIGWLAIAAGTVIVATA